MFPNGVWILQLYYPNILLYYYLCIYFYVVLSIVLSYSMIPFYGNSFFNLLSIRKNACGNHICRKLKQNKMYGLF